MHSINKMPDALDSVLEACVPLVSEKEKSNQKFTGKN